MPTWPYHRGSVPISQAIDAINSRRPVLVTGPAGGGKTSLARAVCGDLDRPIRWIVASESTRGTALAAVAATEDVDVVGDAVRIIESMGRDLTLNGAVLVVEDAGNLDPGSAAVIAAIVRRGSGAGVIVTQRNGIASAPIDDDSALSAALASEDAVRIDVAPLPYTDVAAVIEAYLGDALDPADVGRIHRVSGGNPFYVRQLTTSARSSGALVRTDGGTYRLADDFHITAEVESAAGVVLDAVDPLDRTLLDYLGLLAPIPEQLARALGLDAVFDASRSSEVIAVRGGAAYPMHSIYAEVARSRMGELRRAQLTSTLLHALAEMPDSPIVELHRARLSLAIDRPLPAHVAAGSAAIAFNFGDFALAETLAESAVAGGAGTHAVLQLVRTLAAQGRNDIASRTLAGIDPDSLDRYELVNYVVSACVHYSAGVGDHTTALDILEKYAPRIAAAGPPDAVDAVSAMRAMVSLNASDQFQAIRCARAVRGGPASALWSAMADIVEAEALRKLGEIERPGLIGERGLARAREVGPLVGTGVTHTLVLIDISKGRLDAAEARSSGLMETTIFQLLPKAVACCTMALVAVAKGEFRRAERLLVSTLDTLPQPDHSGLGKGTAAVLASVRAMVGDVAGTRDAHDACLATIAESAAGVPDVHAEQCAGFVRAACGEVTAPAEHFRTAAHLALSRQHVSDGVVLLYWAVRCGDRGAAIDICRDTNRCEGMVADLMVAHARAFLRRDGHGLSAVADEFDRLGFCAYAADATAQAITILRGSGNPRAAATLVPRMESRRVDAGGFSSPAIRAVLTGVVLTQRELEVHTMAALGRSRAEIADALGIKAASVARLVGQARAKVGQD